MDELKTIYDVLKSGEINSRLIVGDKWLVMDQMYDLDWEFVVYQHKYHSKIVHEIYRGQNEIMAIEKLMEG